MEINRNYETEITLKGLVLHVLYRWRSILAVAVICALALSGYQYLSVKRIHDAGKLTKEEADYEADLAEYESEMGRYESLIATYEAQLELQDAYEQDSTYYKLNPNGLWIARRTYLAVVDQSVLDKVPAGSGIDPVDSVLPYYSMLLAGVTEEQKQEVFGTDKFTNELVNSSTDPVANTVSFLVRGESKERVEKESEFLDARIREIAAGSAQEIYPHQLLQIKENVYFGTDTTLKDSVSDSIKDRSDILKNIETAKKKISDLEKKGEPSKPGVNYVVQAAFGFVLGGFLMVLLYLCLYIVNGRLKSGRELTRQVGLPVFGEVIHSGSLHHGRTLDKLIQKWEHVHTPAEEEAVWEGVAALIRELKQEKILLTGTVSAEEIGRVRDALADRLGEETEVAASAGILDNASALTEAIKAPAVILVEKRNASKQSGIRREAEMLVIGKANVIGSIVI